MDWSNETYVRLYIRNTSTWLKWGWEGQALFMFLLRCVDRSGVLDGIVEPIDDLAMITGIPHSHVEVGLRRLLRSGAVEHNNGILLIPNFIEANESSKSDRQRQRECRERRRLAAQAAIVTNREIQRDDGSQNVTTGHELSRAVTSCHAASRAVTLTLPNPDPVPNHDLVPSLRDDTSHSGDLSPPLLAASETHVSITDSGRRKYTYPDNFETFWQAYPNHRGGKKEAYRKWQLAKRSPQWPGDGEVVAAVEAQKSTHGWKKNNGQYVPLAQTWLHQGRWDAEESAPGSGYKSVLEKIDRGEL